jgi:hypothetical protein
MAGLAETNVVDLVAQDAEGTVLVVMVETRPWGADPDQAPQLRAKINAYAGFILDGALARNYPETAGKRVDIQLACPEAPVGEIAAITEHGAAQLQKFEIGFRLAVKQL